MSFNESTINCIHRVYPVVEADAGARAAALSAEPFASWQGLPEPAAAQAAAAEGEAVGSTKSGFHLCSEAGLSLLPGQVSIIKQASLAASIVWAGRAPCPLWKGYSSDEVRAGKIVITESIKPSFSSAHHGFCPCLFFNALPICLRPLSPSFSLQRRQCLIAQRSITQPCRKSIKEKFQFLPFSFDSCRWIAIIARFGRAPDLFVTSPPLRHGVKESLKQSLAASHCAHMSERSQREKEVQRLTQEVAHLKLQLAHTQKVSKWPLPADLSSSWETVK